MSQALSRRAATGDTVEQQTAALVALLEGCANPGVSRRLLLVRVPLLPPDLRRPHHVRLIDAALDPLRSLDRAAFYHLDDDTLAVAWRGGGGEELRAAMLALEQLFADLPEHPVALLDLPQDTQVVAAAIAGSVRRAPAAAAVAGRPMDPAGLAELEAALSQADVAHFIRRKPICAWPAGAPARLAWERRCLSVPDLVAALAPGTAARDDPWLFRRLTRSFDRRMLALLSDPRELRDAGPFALDLNVSSIVGPEFLRFDAALPGPLRGKVMLGVLAADVLADAGGFAFARDFARARGYRLALRGVSAAWLRVFSAELAGVDFMRLRLDEGPAPGLPEGFAARAILCGVGDAAAVAWGRTQGIGLFEGPAVRPDPGTLRRLNLRRGGGEEGQGKARGSAPGPRWG